MKKRWRVICFMMFTMDNSRKVLLYISMGKSVKDLIGDLISLYPEGVHNLVWCGIECPSPDGIHTKLRADRQLFLQSEPARHNSDNNLKTEIQKKNPAFEEGTIDFSALTPASFYADIIRPKGIQEAEINILIVEMNERTSSILKCVRDGVWFPFCEIIAIFKKDIDNLHVSASRVLLTEQTKTAKFSHRNDYSINTEIWSSFTRGPFWLDYHALSRKFVNLQNSSNKLSSRVYHLKNMHEKKARVYEAQIDELERRLSFAELENNKVLEALELLSRSFNVMDKVDSTQKGLPTDIESSEDVLRAKGFWIMANWEALISMKVMKFKGESFCSTLQLLKAAGYYHLNNSEKFVRHFNVAVGRGVDAIAKNDMILSCIFASLAKAAFMRGDREKSNRYSTYSNKNSTSLHNIEMLLQARSLSEITTASLPKHMSDIIAAELAKLKCGDFEHTSDQNQLVIIESELSLVRNMLVKAYSRGLNQPSNDHVATRSHTKSIEQRNVSLEDLRRSSPSQLGQDIWVLQKSGFKRNGFFVEFGAADGVLLSNSYLLEKKYGWRGICAEPNPSFNRDLKKNRNCITSSDCIAGKTGEKVSFVLANEYGGIQDLEVEDMHQDLRARYVKAGEVIELETISLEDFLNKNNAPKEIDYLSVDTEGSEWEILKCFPFDKWDIRYLTVEHNYASHKDDLREYMKSFGYRYKQMEFEDWFFKV